jgi:hypothetical protein
MENIAGSPYDYPQWFNAFYETQNQFNRLNVITRDPEEVFRTSQRFTESYRNNTGINFVYSVSGMMANSYSERGRKEIYERFEEVFEWILKQPQEVRNYVVKETEKLLTSAKPINIEIFVETVLSKFPEYAQEFYEKWGDMTSLHYVMKKAANDLHGIIGGIKW